ncbi:LysR family transcriptional regulator [Vibrio breoganii]|uniref:LysR family transcriptional regulator n=1 Tax=Vibrio breoganii TaxID=553239 RepID=A0AAN1CTZ5_9VIBR|nr:LysR family transcriptional regulator [Vibrio breoganii]ANO35090.1 LysR family transcriptional regulator [Vibrio breoganii]PMG83346.1 LysR family transcriptional regulator [Vibrio breoganii]PMK49155.1 LysR family transcriptional regulator [Vibrio breoganii]PMO27883.1 LysR family transcriptional regulator [Vibrio breoganii]PMO52414.1 LysR family transcriptional regulator [Vibrio breoganii]
MISPITLDALRVLDAIERKKSFAAAADELFRVPSAISYTVNKLEEDLDLTLFDRSKRKADLTPVGHLIVEQGRLILEATNELTYMAKQSASGWELEIRIAIDSILCFKPIYALIEQFQATNPWIDIKITEEIFGGTWDALTAGRSDLIIGVAGDLRNNNFKAHSIGELEFVFAVAKDHPLCQLPPPLSARTIKQYPSIVVADSSRQLATRSAGLLDGQPRITVGNIIQKIDLQLLGLGVGYLPVHRIQEELNSGELVALTVAKPEVREIDLCVAWQKDNKGKALAWFIEQIQALPSEVFLGK